MKNAKPMMMQCHTLTHEGTTTSSKAICAKCASKMQTAELNTV